jgi:hypothetical protein
MQAGEVEVIVGPYGDVLVLVSVKRCQNLPPDEIVPF